MWLSALKTTRFKSILATLFLVALGFSIYFNSLGNEMFWDDADFILKNVFIRDWQNWKLFFSENLIAGSGLVSNYWRPLLLTVFSAEWHIWHAWPIGYHLVNTSFHVADGVLLFFILRLLLGNFALALSVAAVFLVHPLQTEAVVYVNSLGDSLTTFFMFLGILFFIRFRRLGDAPQARHFYFLSLAMYPLALLSKETGFIYPALLFLVEFFLFNSESSFNKRLIKTFKVIWPFLAVAALYLLLRATVLNFSNTFNFYKEPNAFSSNLWIRLLTFFKVLTIYFGLLVWPMDLRVERSIEWSTTFFSLPVVIGALITLILLGFVILRWRKSPVVSFGILWFFVGIAPSSNILIPINAVLYEHWLYLPLIGIFLIVLSVGIRLAEKPGWKIPLTILFVAALSFFSLRSIERNVDWRDAITFYNLTLKHAPNSYRVINNLGMAYNENGFFEKAEDSYRKAISLDPTNPVAYHNLANNYKATGHLPEARENLEKALELNPRFLFSYGQLADIHLRQNDPVGARRVLEEYYRYSPDKLLILENLTKIALMEKNGAAALAYMRRAAALAPHNPKIRQDIEALENILKNE